MDIKKPSLTRTAKEMLLGSPWAGNVRELEHSVERALALSDGREIIGADQFEQLADDAGGFEEMGNDTSLKARMFICEKDFIKKMLIKNNWHVSKTAEELKISRQQLHIKIKKFKLSQDI